MRLKIYSLKNVSILISYLISFLFIFIGIFQIKNYDTIVIKLGELLEIMRNLSE